MSDDFDDLSWMGPGNHDLALVTKHYPCAVGGKMVPLSGPSGETLYNGYWPPIGKAIQFRLHADHDLHLGETVEVRAGRSNTGDITLYGVLEIVNNRRKIHWYRQIASWQLREDDRSSPYGTDLHKNRGTAPYVEAPPDYDPKTQPEIGLTNALIPLARENGSFCYDGYHPPVGLRKALFITHDWRSHIGETVMVVAGPTNSVETAFIALPRNNDGEITGNITRGELFFPENVAYWQGSDL